jgi:hypothetical protein
MATIKGISRATQWLTFCAFFIFPHSLSAQDQHFAGRWIGVHTEWDINSFCRLPAYMDLNPDSTWQLGLVDESAAPRTGTWSLTGGILRLDTTHYAPELISLTGNFLRIGRTEPMLFRRFRAVAIPHKTVWQQLAGQVWQSDTVQYLMATDGRVGVRNRKTGQQTVHYAGVLAMDKSAFLVIRGSGNGREGPIRAFWQIMSNEPGVINLLGGLGQNVGTETLRWVRPLRANEVLQPTVFQTCASCFEQQQATTFFSLSDPNERKLFALFRQRYQPVDLPGQSGLITMKFVRNCAGQLGAIDFQELDSNYKRRPFDKRITDQLRAIVTNELPGSLFGANDNPKRDQLLSFAFRFVDGHLTGIF